MKSIQSSHYLELIANFFLLLKLAMYDVGMQLVGMANLARLKFASYTPESSSIADWTIRFDSCNHSCHTSDASKI